ncbi:unnamed protein product [Dovyalis caffra]|uniref:Uncharacterized protein n=1 Tax=Dovyalis caffra TaxID=77055 RepID=A0AAV1SHB3_9ROSI|nr:unnamed protein product [Dovyalis caffra]
MSFKFCTVSENSIDIYLGCAAEDEISTVESLQFDFSSIVWKNWRDGTPLEVLDPTLTDTYSRNEVIRCIHIGLLCVQEDPAIRPTMATVVLLLNSFSVTLPLPQEPAFFFRSTTDQGGIATKEFFVDQSKSRSVPYTGDEGSITEVYPR